jgi:hypothetical protein
VHLFSKSYTDKNIENAKETYSNRDYKTITVLLPTFFSLLDQQPTGLPNFVLVLRGPFSHGTLERSRGLRDASAREQADRGELVCDRERFCRHGAMCLPPARAIN